MSHANQPHNQPFDSQQGFTLHLGALGKGKSCPPALRGPEHISVPFSATYYDLEDSGKSTPWVGNIDLESHYFQAYGDPLPATPGKGKGRAPEYPGYRVAPVGQLQLVIKTPTKAVKVFLVPYDLRQLPVGGRLLARERTYVSTATHSPLSSSSSPARSAETLRYAVQLQFVCLPSSPLDSRSTLPDAEPSLAYYVSKTVKVVFTSCPPESHEVVRVDRYDEIVPPSDGPISQIGHTLGFSPASSFSPSAHKAEEWQDIRRRWDKLHRPDSPGPEDRLAAPSTRRLERTEGFNPATERAVSPVPSRPASPIFTRRKVRRGSLEERELSDKLRGMTVGE